MRQYFLALNVPKLPSVVGIYIVVGLTDDLALCPTDMMGFEIMGLWAFASLSMPERA
jgi:hypothetical protein